MIDPAPEPICLDQRYRPQVLSAGGRSPGAASAEASELRFTTSSWSLAQVLAGTIELCDETLGQRCVLRPGTIWLAEPGRSCQARLAPGTRWRFCYFLLSAQPTRPGRGGSRYPSRAPHEADAQAIWGCRPPLVIEPPVALRVETLLSEIQDEYWRGPGGRLRADALLALALAEIVAPLMAGPPAMPQADDPVTRAQVLVREALPRPLEVAEIAVRLGLSREHLSRLFRQRSGQSLAAWQRAERLHLAARRLRDGSRVATVARDCGWRSTSAFASAFRHRYGSSPQAYAHAHAARPA